MTEDRNGCTGPAVVTMDLRATDTNELQWLVAVAALGMCQALKARVVTPADACQKLLGPALLTLLEQQEASPQLRNAIHLATELEDVSDLVPNSLEDSIADIESSLIDAMHKLPPPKKAQRWLVVEHRD